MTRLCALILLSVVGCAGYPEKEPVRTIPPARYYAPPRTLRVIGTESDMTLAGKQYCKGLYSLQFTTLDKTEGLITCD